jgi:acetyltransferase EpsM
MDGRDKTQQVVILGAGGTGLLIADSILRNPHNDLVGFLDDDPQKKNIGQGKFPVLGALSVWRSLPPECRFISSLYGPKRNVEYYLKIRSLGIPEDRWANIVDPSAIISLSVALGSGVYVGPATVLEPGVSLGNWCAMLGSVYIAHDTCIDAYTACANSVSIAGGVRVGVATFVGANATVREYLQIGRYAVVGMGAVVIRDIPEASVAVGNPSRIVGEVTPTEFL